MAKTVDMNDLTLAFRRTCEVWYAALPLDKRSAVDAWLVEHPLPPRAPLEDRVVYAFCEAPPRIDPWVICQTAAKDVTPEWISQRQPLVEILPSGDMRAQFRESELREVARA